MAASSPKNTKFQLFYALSLAYQLGFIIVVPIGIGMLAGFWLDSKLTTRPFFLFVGLIFGIVTCMYEVYHVLIPFFKKNNE